MRLRNLSKHCLLRFLCLNIKIYFTVCAVKRFKYCNTKLDPAELLSLRKGLGSIRGVFGPMSKISFTLSNYRFVIWDKNYRRYFVISGTLP